MWLSTLPSLLCSSQISERTIDLLALIARQNNGMFHQALVKRIPSILGNRAYIIYTAHYLYFFVADNLGSIIITDTDNQKSSLLKMVSVIYYTPILYNNNLEAFSKFLDKNQDSNLFHIVRNMLKLR